MIVAGTCLIFHLFNETLLTNSAQKILEKDPCWVLPPLWREEYANVLSKLARKEGRAINDVVSHFNYTMNELKNCEISIDTKKALQISIDFNTLLITEDKEILKNCSHLALSLQNFLKK